LRFCEAILRDFAEYLRSRPQPISALLGMDLGR
jgi:hypothetical protein